MSCIQYIEKRFKKITQEMIDRSNLVLDEYAAQGLSLTLRQLYYQFVARGWLANKQANYKRLGEAVNDGRLAGLIDWNAIIDRTRNLLSVTHWANPRQIVDAVVPSYAENLWEDQPNYVEVWIKKDALIGVIERVCNKNDVAYFSCRGYVSQSEMHAAALRLEERSHAGQQPHIIHLGDHDPSGCHITVDIEQRIEMFVGPIVEVHRIALNMDQIKKYNPPPNPAKTTDSRSTGYIARHGTKSWELDALDPKVLHDLIQGKINELRDAHNWNDAIDRQEANREKLRKAAASIKV